MPRTKKEKASTRIPRKNQIETIATNMFKERGFAATSMRDLASAVGIEAASIYSHVQSKEEILHTICFKMAHEFFEAIEISENKTATYPERLQELILAHITIILRNVAAAVVFQNEWRHLSEPYLSHFLELREQYETRFRALIQKGTQAGEFVPTDAQFVTRTLLLSLNGIPQWYAPNAELTPENIAEKTAALFLNGLRKADK